MNYTFAHLRCLIAWLFNTPAHYANGKNRLGDAEDYLFEVKTKVKLYSPLYKPGQLKGGHCCGGTILRGGQNVRHIV